MKKQKRFLAKAVRKVSLIGADLKFNKEFLIRRDFGSYASLDKDKIRYTIYKLAKGTYAIVGKCLIAKSKNFQLEEVSIAGSEKQEFLTSFVQDKFNNRNLFLDFVNREFSVKL